MATLKKFSTSSSGPSGSRESPTPVSPPTSVSVPPIPSADLASSSSPSPPSQKRKRGTRSVTSNACNACKRAKAKCDGATPICLRCRERGQGNECHYEMHTKLRKEELVREVKQLRDRNSWVERILSAIRNDEQGAAIVERLRDGESYEAISKSLGRTPFPEFPTLTSQAQKELTRAIAEYSMDMEGERRADDVPPGAKWTAVTGDDDLIDCLIALYFIWVHPVHMFLSENHFMASYKNRSDLYCNTCLVNAICAMGCHLMDISADDAAKWGGLDLHDLGNKFFREALSTIPQDEVPKMTTIQSYALLFLTELGSGKASRASNYLRLAGEGLNIRLQHHYSTEVMEITKWGIYALSVAWASLTFQVPNVSPIAGAPSDVFKHVIMNTHDGIWWYYRHPELENASVDTRSAILVARETARLMLHVHRAIDILYHKRGSLSSASQVTERYQGYLDWERDLPVSLKLSRGILASEADGDVFPHVLSLHIQFHTAIIHLFQPFLHLRHISGSAHQLILDVIIYHARKCYEALRAYKEIYTCRFSPSLQTFCLLTACDILIRYSPKCPDSTGVVECCLEYLKETTDSASGFAICGPLQEMFRRSAVECGVKMPDNLEELMGQRTYGPESMVDVTLNLTYKQPVMSLVPGLESKLGAEFATDLEEQVKLLIPRDVKVSVALGPSTKRIEILDLLNG